MFHAEPRRRGRRWSRSLRRHAPPPRPPRLRATTLLFAPSRLRMNQPTNERGSPSLPFRTQPVSPTPLPFVSSRDRACREPASRDIAPRENLSTRRLDKLDGYSRRTGGGEVLELEGAAGSPNRVAATPNPVRGGHHQQLTPRGSHPHRRPRPPRQPQLIPQPPSRRPRHPPRRRQRLVPSAARSSRS